MLGRGQRASKKRPEPSGFLALLALAALSSGCASNQYMEISLKPGGADSAVQALAMKAQGGDKQSQYELGRWFEGSTDPKGIKKAVKLYRVAATSRGGTRLLYTPGPSGVTTSAISTGPFISANEPAKIRLRQLSISAKPHSAQEDRSIEGFHKKFKVKLKVKASILKLNEEFDELACLDFKHELENLYESTISECQAFRYEFNYNSRIYVAFDFVITIPIEVAEERGYPTNLVDPVELAIDSESNKYFIIQGFLFEHESSKAKVVLIQNIRGIR